MRSKTDILLGTLLFGSLWGFSEVVLGKLLRAAALPFKGSVLMGISVGIMLAALAIYRRPLMLLGITAITLACKILAVPLLEWEMYYNSLFAVALIGMFTAITSAVLLEKKGIKYTVLNGLTAALITSIVFYFAGMRLAPCRYLLSFAGLEGFGRWILHEALLWGAFSAAFGTAGYWAGTTLTESLERLELRQPVAYYGGSIALSIIFIISCAVVNAPLI